VPAVIENSHKMWLWQSVLKKEGNKYELQGDRSSTSQSQPLMIKRRSSYGCSCEHNPSDEEREEGEG
jgi:hypothetical protein